MKVRCEAFVENDKQRENLIECIRILGGEPEEVGFTVSVEYEGENVSMFEALFEHFDSYTTTISA